MRATIRLTLDGLVAALRWRAHALADGQERAYADARERGRSRAMRAPGKPGRTGGPRGRSRTRGANDDGRGR